MKLSILIILIFTISGLAQEKSLKLSGNLNQDFHISSLSIQQDNTVEPSVVLKKRSVPLAAGLSLVFPGAGQFYNEDYWISALFVTIEAAAVVTAIVYDGKGDDQTTFFQNFANSEDGWSVDKYANWSVDNASRINPEITEGDPVLDIFDDKGDVVWSKLNKLESTIGRWYSHQLAPFNDQQYYEMIGKYSQFNSGWADFNPDEQYTYGDPVTDTFLWYADQRGKANEYYDVSNLAVKILLANHIISAVEAAFSTNRYNKSIAANVKMKSHSIGYYRDFYPELNVSYRF